MNKKIIIGVAVVFGLMLVAGGGYFFVMRQRSAVVPSTTNPVTVPVAANSVEIKDFAYNPRIITVKVGATVTFTNRDIAGHSATADDGSFDTGILKFGQSGTVTFDRAGSFAYHCSAHPNMRATVVVEQ